MISAAFGERAPIREPPRREAEHSESRDRSEERDRAENVQEELELGPHAPGFQIISARIAIPASPAPQESASVSGSRILARNSGLGRSRSAASRSARRRVSASRAPPWRPATEAATSSTSETTIQGAV